MTSAPLPPIYTVLTADAAVQALVGNRVYRHGSAPQGNKAAYLTWQVANSTPANTLSELPQIDLVTLQVDCFSPSDSGVEALAQAVRDALEPQAHLIYTAADGRDPQTRLFCIGLSFDYWLGRMSF